MSRRVNPPLGHDGCKAAQEGVIDPAPCCSTADSRAVPSSLPSSLSQRCEPVRGGNPRDGVMAACRATAPHRRLQQPCSLPHGRSVHRQRVHARWRGHTLIRISAQAPLSRGGVFCIYSCSSAVAAKLVERPGWAIATLPLRLEPRSVCRTLRTSVARLPQCQHVGPVPVAPPPPPLLPSVPAPLPPPLRPDGGRKGVELGPPLPLPLENNCCRSGSSRAASDSSPEPAASDSKALTTMSSLLLVRAAACFVAC